MVCVEWNAFCVEIDRSRRKGGKREEGGGRILSVGGGSFYCPRQMLLRRVQCPWLGAVATGGASPLLPNIGSYAPLAAIRGIMADKLKAGMLLRIDKRVWRVGSCTRQQKGQNAASFHVKLREGGGNGRTKESTSGQGHEYSEARYERVRLLFSGFDETDLACFVYPQHHNMAGQEVNIPAATLPEYQQKFLCVAMPCDVTHVFADEEDGPATADSDSENASAIGAAAKGKSTAPGDMWCEVVMPSNYVYTVEKLSVKGMYKLAHFVECDGSVTVSDNIQPGDKVKVVVRPDGTASFQQKL